MKLQRERKNVVFKQVHGIPVLAWAANQGHTTTTEDQTKAFDGFPNIKTAKDMIEVYENLAHSPIYPRHLAEDVDDITDPAILLDALQLPHTRKNINEVKDTLALHTAESDAWSILPVHECITMTRDMKALLTVLMFSYGMCGAHALELNTENDFAFLYEWDEGQSLYGNYIRNVREEDPNALEVDHYHLSKDIKEMLDKPNELTDKKTLKSMSHFAERYVNGFMWTVHPALNGGSFLFMQKDCSLGSIYAHWAELISSEEALACRNCGKLVARPRKGQMYCSKSCKVQASKKGLNKETG